MPRFPCAPRIPLPGCAQLSTSHITPDAARNSWCNHATVPDIFGITCIFSSLDPGCFQFTSTISTTVSLVELVVIKHGCHIILCSYWQHQGGFFSYSWRCLKGRTMPPTYWLYCGAMQLAPSTCWTLQGLQFSGVCIILHQYKDHLYTGWWIVIIHSCWTCAKFVAYCPFESNLHWKKWYKSRYAFASKFLIQFWGHLWSWGPFFILSIE